LNPSSSIHPWAWTRNALAATLAGGLLLAASPATSQDFTLAGTDLQKRVNVALAMMQYCLTPEVTTSSLSINAGGAADGETGQEAEFLRQGQLNAVGYGGSLMLDYEHYREPYEIDVEARLTNVWLQSTRGSSAAVKGSALSQSASLWTRWRAPTGFRALDRPFRYVL